MAVSNALGYLAAGLVLATFCMTSMRLLRSLAILSNLAFIAYGLTMELPPVLLLHAVLLPINMWQLVRLSVN